jgi:hypothetical protein
VKCPDHLFHYTTLDNLALILRNKTIRFSRLDKVNDPEEALTKHFPAAKFFLYVSCWTSHENESLPLWSIYSSNMKGVRIRLPINMFVGRQFPKYETTGFPIINIDSNIMIKRDDCFYTALLNGPMPIQYTKEPLNYRECFIEKGNGALDIDLLHLGLAKYDYWNFEEEWRFRIIGMPFEGSWRTQDYDRFLRFPLSEYLDIHLDQSVLSELVVQLGPRATLSNSIVVELLLSEFAPGAKLCDSACKIKNSTV